jgi:hypothetical protein
VPVLAVQQGRRQGLGNGTGLESLNDVHGMGLVDGLHDLDAIAQRAREEHGVVDGVAESATFLDSHGGPGRQHLGA